MDDIAIYGLVVSGAAFALLALFAFLARDLDRKDIAMNGFLRAALTAAWWAAASSAFAQSYLDANNTQVPGVVLLSGCGVGVKCAGPASAANPFQVQDAGAIAALNALAITPPLPVAQQAQTYADVSQSISASGNSGILNHPGASISAYVAISNITGGEYASLELDSCPDGTATSCTKVWGGNYYSAANSFVIPPMPLSGPYRWAWSAGGSGAITFAVTATHSSAIAPTWYGIYASTFSSAVSQSVSGTLPAAGCKVFTTFVVLGSGTAPTIQMEGSLDGFANWQNIGSTVTPTAAATTMYSSPTGGVVYPYLRYQVTATGTASNTAIYYYCT